MWGIRDNRRIHLASGDLGSIAARTHPHSLGRMVDPLASASNANEPSESRRARRGRDPRSSRRNELVDRALLDVSKPPTVEVQFPPSPHDALVDGGLVELDWSRDLGEGARAQTQLPLPESENGVVGSAM